MEVGLFSKEIIGGKMNSLGKIRIMFGGIKLVKSGYCLVVIGKLGIWFHDARHNLYQAQSGKHAAKEWSPME